MADERLPYKGTSGELVIPMDAPERFRWWRSKSRPLSRAEIDDVLRTSKLQDVYLAHYSLVKRWGSLTEAEREDALKHATKSVPLTEAEREESLRLAREAAGISEPE